MTAMAANAGRCPVSAQCEMLGVARSTYYSMRSRAESPKPPDPIEPDVPAAHEASRGRHGARKIKASLARRGITASRRRICRIMRENGLASAYGRKKPKCHPGRSNEAGLPNVVARQFGGREPRTHVCSDLAYVRVGGGWSRVCLLVDLANREIVGHSAGPRKDADLARAAFATVEFPLSDIQVFHTDRGSEFDNAKIDGMLEAFGIERERSPSKKGMPLRKRGRRIDGQDPEGGVRLPRGVRHDSRAAGQAGRLRALAQQLQDSLDAGMHDPGRVQEGRHDPPGIVQIGIANPGRWKAGNVSGCVAESACCRKLSAQPCQHSNHRFLFRWPMKPGLRHVGNHSGRLVQSNRLRPESTLIAGRPSSHPEFIAQTPMPGRPPSPSLAPPHSLRTRLFRQGAKNFCCAKLGPCRVFASFLALGQNLSGFRITRQAKGAGREQTEVIMSNFELQEKAVKAATRFIERKGFELLETGWTSPEGAQIDLIASDEDTLVFIDVTATEYGEGGFEGGKVKRSDFEIAAAS